MLRILLLLMLTVRVPGDLVAQAHRKFLYAGLETGLQLGSASVDPAGSAVAAGKAFSLFSGVQIQQELNRHVLVGSGLYVSGYGVNFSFTKDEGSIRTQRTTVWRIPLRVYVQTPVLYGIPELQLGACAGYHLALNARPMLGDSLTGFLGSDVRNSYYRGRYSYPPATFSLAELSVYLNLMLAKGTVFTLGASYYAGFSDLFRLDLQYREGAGLPDRTATVSAKGNMVVCYLGVRYPVSRWLNRPKKRSTSERPLYF